MKVNLTNIRKTLLFSFLLVWMILVLLSFSHFSDLQLKQEIAFAKDKAATLSEEVKLEVSENAQRLDALITFIESDGDIIRTFLDQDREGLMELLAPQFERLKLRHNVTHFYFHTPEGNNFLRVHKPEKHGDFINRITLRRAVDSGETTSGLEFGTLGHFVHRVVRPWRYKGMVIGYIELGEEIDEIIASLAKANDYEMFLGVRRDYLGHLKERNLPYVVSSGNRRWTFTNHIVTYQYARNDTMMPRNFINLYNNGDAQIFQNSGQYWLVSAARIYDVENHLAANLFFVSNVTDSLGFSDRIFLRFMFWSVLAGCLLFIFYLIYTGRIQKQLQSVGKIEQENTRILAKHSRILAQNELLKSKIDLHERSLNESQKRYHALFERTADALLLIDGNNFIDCNQATLDMLGYNTKEELYDTHPSVLSPARQPDGRDSTEKANEMISIAFQKGSHRFEWNHMRKNGEVFPVEVLLTSIPYGEKNLLYTVWRDITERKRAEKEVNFLAQYDALTELPNRRLLFKRLEEARNEALSQGKFHAVLFIDLDRFKNINDSMGHTVGDQLLINSAKRIKNQLRDQDTLARFGGDEFVVLIKDLGNSIKYAGLYSERVAETIRQRFQSPIEVAQFDMQVTVSIGISVFPLENESVEEVLRHADMAMYRAKENGRNQSVFFISSMQEDVIRRLTIEKDMHEAIKKREIAVYYQPQISPEGDIVGVEALARWQHPHYGYIPPDEFVHIAEETGQIVNLGNLVMEKAVADILSVEEMTGKKLNLSLNISARQLSFSDFLPAVTSLVRHYQVTPSEITLEITESVMAENFASIRTKLKELKDMGIRISLDDFGTGYSSLSYLKQLPLDELKIDRSFVMELHADSANLNLVTTIISIGHQFGLVVVAEGVENEDQLAFLKSQNCGLYQGYFFSKPVPVETLLELLVKEKNKILNIVRHGG